MPLQRKRARNFICEQLDGAGYGGHRRQGLCAFGHRAEPPREMLWGGGEDIASIVADVKPKSDIRLFFHTALTREAARSRPARLKWSHLLNTSATTLRRYSLNILKELGKV